MVPERAMSGPGRLLSPTKSVNYGGSAAGFGGGGGGGGGRAESYGTEENGGGSGDGLGGAISGKIKWWLDRGGSSGDGESAPLRGGGGRERVSVRCCVDSVMMHVGPFWCCSFFFVLVRGFAACWLFFFCLGLVAHRRVPVDAVLFVSFSDEVDRVGGDSVVLYVLVDEGNSSAWVGDGVRDMSHGCGIRRKGGAFRFLSFLRAVLLLLLLLILVVTLFARHRLCVSRFIYETPLSGGRFLSQTLSVFLAAWCSSSESCRRRHHNDSLVLFRALDENCVGKQQGEFASSVASPPASVSTARSGRTNWWEDR